MKRFHVGWLGCLPWVLLLALLRVSGSEPYPVRSEDWRYQLLAGSTYLDDCPICGRPSILQPLRGSFLLSAGNSDPLYTRFRLTEIHLVVGGNGPGAIHLDGTGELTIGGEVAVQHRMTLELTVTRTDSKEVVRFDSGMQPGEPRWPGIEISMVELDPTLVRELHLDFDAMPIRDLWFSTSHGFTSSQPEPKGTPVSGADLLSPNGNVVVPAAKFSEALSLKSPDPLLNIDAVDVLPGGLVHFSLWGDGVSTVLGNVRNGDLYSLGGSRVKSFVDFTRVVSPEPPYPDLGLDALHTLADGRILFSLTQPVFSQALGVTVGPGDVLSSDGKRWRRNSELLKAFHPLDPTHDYGLDALYVWPSGEVWFSTEESVALDGFQTLLDGDLLSDTGRVIFRNLELVGAFSPMEDAANFGLDALVVATDAVDPAKPPAILSVTGAPAAGTVRIEWSGMGRFFQVEAAAGVSGPYSPVTGLLPGNSAVVPSGAATAFYRLRQW